jgi:hypothetical protein
MNISTISWNCFHPKPIVDFASLQEAKKRALSLKRVGWCFEMMGRAGLFVTAYQVLEYGFRAFRLNSTLIALAVAVAGLAYSRLCQRFVVEQLAELTPEKELNIYLEYYKQYLREQPIHQEGVKGNLIVGHSLSLKQQRELLDLAYPKGILVVFNQYQVQLRFEDWREIGLVKLKKEHPYVHQQIYDSYRCIVDFIERRLTNAKRVSNPDEKQLDVNFINSQLSALGFKWMNEALVPLFSVKDDTTVVLGKSACLLGSEVIPFIDIFATRDFNMEINRSYLATPINKSYLKQIQLMSESTKKKANVHTIDYDKEEIDVISTHFLALRNELIAIRKSIASPSQSNQEKSNIPSQAEQEANWEFLKTCLRGSYRVRWNFIEFEPVSVSKPDENERAFLRERRVKFFEKNDQSCQNTNNEKTDA